MVQYNSFFKHKKGMICNIGDVNHCTAEHIQGKRKARFCQISSRQVSPTQTREPVRESRILENVNSQHISMYSIYFLLVMAQRDIC